MKKIILIFSIVLFISSCSNDDKFITISGRVERASTGEGIDNQVVYLFIGQAHGSGPYGSYYTNIESKQVTTDLNGNFSLTVKSVDRMFVKVSKSPDNIYAGSELKGFNPNDKIILKVQKFLKFKIYVKNVNPFDLNDFININLVSGNVQNFRTKIENFGIENIKYPEENLPGGGTIGAFEDASWRGLNVNSIVHYNVPENAESFSIVAYKKKNGIDNTIVIHNIPFQIDQINTYNFDY